MLVINAAINIIRNVAGYPESNARSVKCDSVKKKLNIRTLNTDLTKLYIRWIVTIAVNKTPNIYTVIVLASLNPTALNIKPKSVAAISIITLFMRSDGTNFIFSFALRALYTDFCRIGII